MTDIESRIKNIELEKIAKEIYPSLIWMHFLDEDPGEYAEWYEDGTSLVQEECCRAAQRIVDMIEGHDQ